MYVTMSEKGNTPMLDPIFVVIRFGSADKLFVSGRAAKSKLETIRDAMI